MAAGARPAPAQADDSALDVTVNGVPVSVEAALASDPYDETAKDYTECFSSGASSTVILTGWSVATLIAAAGTTASNVTSVSVARNGSDAGSVVLTPADYDPSAAGYPTFTEGPALVMPRRDGGALATRYTFFRPYRGADCASDPNGGDYVQTPLAGTLSIAIAAGTMLDVTSTEDRNQASTTTPVAYSGSVSNPPAGETLSYRWSFSDGSVAMGPNVTHTYAAAGTYTATLSVSSGAAAGGQASPLSVTVGAAAGSSPAPGGGTGKTAGPTAPSHRASAKPSSPARSASPTVTTVSSARTTAAPARAPTQSVSSATSSAPPAVSPPVAITPTAGPSTAAASVAVSATPTSTPIPVATALAAGEPIAGLLIAGLTRQVEPAEPDVVRAEVQQLTRNSAGSATSAHGVALGAAGTGLGTLVLLGVGAALEFRRGRR